MTGLALDQPTATLVAGILAAVCSSGVGIAAILFAWANTRTAFQQQRNIAEDDRRWTQQHAVYQDIAEWLATHQLAGRDEPLVEPDQFANWTSDPGMQLEGKARLFASQSVEQALIAVRKKALLEQSLADMARHTRERVERGYPFAESIFSESLEWKNPADAHRQLMEVREEWVIARANLEAALRDIYLGEQVRTQN